MRSDKTDNNNVDGNESNNTSSANHVTANNDNVMGGIMNKSSSGQNNADENHAVGNGPGPMMALEDACEDINSPESLCEHFDTPPSPEPSRYEDIDNYPPRRETKSRGLYSIFTEEDWRDKRYDVPTYEEFLEREAQRREEEAREESYRKWREEEDRKEEEKRKKKEEEENNKSSTDNETGTTGGGNANSEDETGKKSLFLNWTKSNANAVGDGSNELESSKKDDDASKSAVSASTSAPGGDDEKDKAKESAEPEPEISMDTEAEASADKNCNGLHPEKDKDAPSMETTEHEKDKDISDANAGDAADDNAMEVSSPALASTDDLESSQPSSSQGKEKMKDLGDGILLNLNLDGDDDGSKDASTEKEQCITDSRPTSPTNDNGADEGSKKDEDSNSNQGKEKEKPSTTAKASSETESDEESDKPQIFLRDFSEITEQQSDSEEEDARWQAAIPSGIRSSYHKTISELQECSEDSTSSSKEMFASRLNEIATFDASLSNLNLDCDVEEVHRRKRSTKLAAYKLNAWLVRKKDRQQNGILEPAKDQQPQLSSIPAPITMQPVSVSQLPISVSPCVSRPGQVPLRWPQSVSISSSNNMATISMAPNTYAPQSMIHQPPPPPVRVEWPSSVQRMATRPNAPMHPQVSFQQVNKSNTTTSFSTAPRLSTIPGNNMQQQQVTQLIFDPSTGGVILCPTNQLPQQQQQPHLMQNNRMSNPQNIQIQNGVILRPGMDRNGLEISMLNAAAHVQAAPRLPPPPPVVMQRVSSPVRPPVSQFPRPPMNPRSARPQQPQPMGNQRQAPGGPPGLQPLNNSQQARNRNSSNSTQSMANLGNPAANPPRYPSPRVSGIPPVRQITTPKPSTTAAPGTVGAGVTAGNQKPIPGTVDEGESDLQNKTFPSLVVHVKTILSVKPDRAGQTKARSELDSSVKGVLVNTPAQFTEWLMRRGLLRLDHFCDVHNSQTFKLGMYSDVSRQPFSGGYVWTSECCPDRQISVYSGSIFEGSKYPPGTVLKLIYHWACQTPANNVLQWVKVSSLYLKNFFTLLRAVCISWLHEMCPPLGGEQKYVEIGVITLGSSAETSRGVKNVNVEILGVFDPTTKIVRMKVINSMQGQLYKDKNKGNVNANEQGARAFQILWPLTHWVDKRSILLVDGIIDKALFHELGFKNIQQCSESVKTSATNMNVMNYLRNLVPKMFSSTLSVLSKSIVQQFLDELSWREMYGQTVLTCFENVLDHIGTMTKWDLTPDTLISRLNKVYQNPFVDWSNSKQSRRCPMNTIPLSLRNEPGIRECIRHVMKDDKGSASLLASNNQKASLAPQPTPTYTNSKTVQNQNAAQKRKLVENTLSSNLAFYKSHAARNPKQINLQQYYYGKQKGDDEMSAADIIPLPPNLKCPLCVRTFSNNAEIIRHLFMHVTSILSRNESNICSTCLKDLPTGVTPTQHMNQVHKMVGHPFNCRICEEKFRNEDEMIFHMWDLHSTCEAPYRCSSCSFATSFHYEIVQHYQEKHANSGSVMCPFCTRIMPAYSLAMLKNIISHLQSHGTRRVKKCSRCVLTFANENELDIHMVNHLPVTKGPTWSQYNSQDGEIITMAVPPMSRTPLQLLPLSQLNALSSSTPPPKKPKVSSTKKKNDSKSTLNASFAVPLDTNEKFGGSKYRINIPAVDKGKAICVECQKDATDPNHYIGRLVCSKCRYITACQGAMDLHHERSHRPGMTGTKPGLKTKPVAMLNEALVCKCGFTSNNPYKIARHLVKCEKLTVFPKSKLPALKDTAEDLNPPSAPAIPADPPAPPPPPSTTSQDGPGPFSPGNLGSMLEPITTFEDMLSLDASLDTSFESLSLPPLVLSPTSTMPQTPMPGPSFISPTGSQPPPPSNNADSDSSTWNPDSWELPLSGLIAKCGQPQQH